MRKLSRLPILDNVKIDQPLHIGSYNEDRDWLQAMSPAGYTIVINHTPFGVEFFDSTYSVEWQEMYKSKHMLWVDPIILNAMWHGASNKRWSEITAPDVRGVWKAAELFGMKYGAAFARTRRMKKSLLSLARQDREFTDQEMTDLAEWFDRFLDIADGALNLSEKEIEVVRLLARDMNIEDVSNMLGLTQSAVKTRLRQARTKAGCKSNYSLIAKASQAGLL